MALRRNASKYGASSSHADEDTLPTETQTSFFQKGREFESRYVNHHYTEEEREMLGTFESVDYLPPHSAVYKVSRGFHEFWWTWSEGGGRGNLIGPFPEILAENQLR